MGKPDVISIPCKFIDDITHEPILYPACSQSTTTFFEKFVKLYNFSW